ncbi:quercetin 2,3-dioxygenase [Leptolyngbya valderiana BDU 20041]|nr:quercetin 2,3-dioxygenase [Leptolyngbya valderiana BDU 20041]
MLAVRKSEARGTANYGWLKSYHSFSFANYYDPNFMGFRSLRVVNEDTVAGGTGFGTHPHREMEIISYVLEGVLEHEDSTGGRSRIRAGEVQRMTAGTGIAHSEFNGSQQNPVRLLQIWILPNQRGLPPSYEQKTYSEADKRGRWCLVASPDGRERSLTVHQDVLLYATILSPGETLTYALSPQRYAWLQVVRGDIEVNGAILSGGDAVSVEKTEALDVSALSEAEVLLFDLA